MFTFRSLIRFVKAMMITGGLVAISFSCNSSSDDGSSSSGGSTTPGDFTGAPDEVKLMTLDPGHFHAALVQKNHLNQVDSTVYIYAPEGPDLELHLERIEGFNERDSEPASWKSEIYTGGDYLERMLEEKPGNVMVTAGNNSQKTAYIHQAVENGIHVLSDKPMAIDNEGWNRLVEAFETARREDVLLYDIMTQRHEVTSRIQRELARRETLFGTLREGTSEEPSIELESVHHLFKTVAGQPLQRPPWYFDVNQQGEGIVDVTVHLVDLSMWVAFPERAFNHEEDVHLIEAKRWPTILSPEQFSAVTGLENFPEYLNPDLKSGDLHYYSNGEMIYTLDGHHVRVSVQWNYEAQPGSDDTHFSVLRGTKSNLVIRQGEEQGYQSTLYVEPSVPDPESTGRETPEDLESALQEVVSELQEEFPGLSYSRSADGWVIHIPPELHRGHEAHFGDVAESFFEYLVVGRLPEWEVPNMITKYFITTRARDLALNRTK